MVSEPFLLLFLRWIFKVSPKISIYPDDHSKTTFTCPYGTYAYRKMSFGLCNAPASFQRCMMSIFSDKIEKIMEVFMDDFLFMGKPLMIDWKT